MDYGIVHRYKHYKVNFLHMHWDSSCSLLTVSF